MADSVELNKLIATMERLTKGLETSAASAGIRVGRGGNSNGSAAGNRDPEKVSKVDTESLRKTQEKLVNTVRSQINAGRRWETAIRTATNSTEAFLDTVDRLEGNLQTSNMATRAVTTSTLKLAKQQGISTGKLLELNETAISYSKTVSRLDKLKAAYAQAEAAHMESDQQIANKKKEISASRNKAARRVLEAELANLKAAKDSIRSLEDIEKAIDSTAEEIVRLNGKLGKETIPALDGFSSAVTTAQTKQELLAVANDVLKSTTEDLNARTVAQSEAVKESMKQQIAYNKTMQDARTEIVKSTIAMAKNVTGVAGLMIDNFRARVRYNVKESHYMSAAGMGLSGPQLSEFLGQNARMLRLMNGDGNNEAVLDGRLQELQKSTTALYGVSGPEAMQLMADAGNSLLAAGINLKEAPGALNQHLKDVSAMADRLGMVKGELISFQKELSESGDLAFMTSKYSHLGAQDAQKAMDRELEARIANAKMLGLSTAHVKEQIQIERKNRYGTLENQIMGVIGAKMDESLGRKNGAFLSPEMQRVREKHAMGGKLTDEENKTLSRANHILQNAHENAITDADARGDKNAMFGLGVQRQISSNFGSQTFTAEAMADYAKTEAALDTYDSTGAAKRKYLATGEMPESVRKQLTNADDPNSFGWLGQLFSRGKTIADGVQASPLGPLLKDVSSILHWVRVIAINSLMNGPGGAMLKRIGGNIFGKMAKTRVAGAVANTGIKGWAAGANVFKGAGLNAAAASGLGAVGGNATSKLGLKTIGASKLGKIFSGGLIGMTAGLAGDAVDGLGSNIKDNAIAGGSRNNNTILDKETAGATMSMVGKSASWAATGAMIGSVIPLAGTATGAIVGGVLGAAKGAYDNLDTIVHNFNTVSDGITNIFKPSETLERSREEARQAKQGDSAPQEVILAGEQGEAVVKSGANSDKLVESADEQVKDAKKKTEFFKSKQDIRAMMQGIESQVATSQQRFSDMDA